MHSYRIVWEDEAKARDIELIVRYGLQAGVVTVNEVRPTVVTLYDNASKQPLRSLPVHTATARRLLAAAHVDGHDAAGEGEGVPVRRYGPHAVVDTPTGARRAVISRSVTARTDLTLSPSMPAA